MSAVSATTQDVVVGNLVSQQPAVALRDSRGRPAEGVVVTFVDTAITSPFTATSGADGIATAPWFVGKRAGTERLTALVQGLTSVVFVANVRPDAPTVIFGVSDYEQIGSPGALLPSQPRIKVMDQYNNGTSGVTVTFAAAGPLDAAATNTTAITDSEGYATYGPWTLGTAIGEYTIKATFPGEINIPVTFRARINKPFPASLVAAGGFASCAVAASGGLFCWGQGLFASSTSIPTPVPGAVPFVSLSMGRNHGCGLTSAGAAYCWGNNGTGQLGIGSLSANEGEPRPVGGGLSFASLVAGDSFTCGLTTDQRVWCWGDNSVGELGNGGTTASLAPSAVATAEHFTVLTAGNGHVCAIATTTTTYCWGGNNTGQLGVASPDFCPVSGYDYYGNPIATQVRCSKKPIALPNGPGPFTALVASNGTCGLIAGDQRATCWGYAGDQLIPTAQFQTLAAAGESICGITTAQSILCWSYADPYGYGVTIPPTIVFGVTAPTSLVAGFGHWCAISGTVGPAYCWGNNDSGQLGDGLHMASTIALPVAAP